jgi:hypothetical protein
MSVVSWLVPSSGGAQNSDEGDSDECKTPLAHPTVHTTRVKNCRNSTLYLSLTPPPSSFPNAGVVGLRACFVMYLQLQLQPQQPAELQQPQPMSVRHNHSLAHHLSCVKSCRNSTLYLSLTPPPSSFPNVGGVGLLACSAMYLLLQLLQLQP